MSSQAKRDEKIFWSPTIYTLYTLHCRIHEAMGTCLFLFTVWGTIQIKFWLCSSQSVSPGGELLAGAGDERWTHGASLPALLPAGLGASCSRHHCPGHRLAWWLRMDNTQCLRTGARRCVSVTAVHTWNRPKCNNVFSGEGPMSLFFKPVRLSGGDFSFFFGACLNFPSG